MGLAHTIKVGCCGYPTSMKEYYENFSLVEVNRTFYGYPEMPTVVGWREKAPSKFEFTVKAHQDISHKFRFELKPSLEAFESMTQICKTLKARILLIQTPGSFRPERLSDAARFFRKIKRDDLMVIWETRGKAWNNLDVGKKLAGILESLGVTHVTDLLEGCPSTLAELLILGCMGLEKNYTIISIPTTN